MREQAKHFLAPAIDPILIHLTCNAFAVGDVLYPLQALMEIQENNTSRLSAGCQSPTVYISHNKGKMVIIIFILLK